MLNAFLTNIKVLAKTTSPKTISKEPYFDRKWGNQAAFEKSIDRSDYSTVDAQDSEAQIHDQILVMFKTKKKTDMDRSAFLNKITHDSRDFLDEQRERMQRTRQEEELCQNSMAVMTEHIFEILKSYSYELNNALGYGHFHVAATNPQTVTEVLKYTPQRQPEETITYYRARLSTTLFSLVLRGDKRGIQFFVIPVSRAMGLSKQESFFMPVVRLSTSLVDGCVSWKTEEGLALTPSMVELICMDLFQRLIEETKVQVRKQEEEALARERTVAQAG
jgi:hypothetical protein